MSARRKVAQRLTRRSEGSARSDVAVTLIASVSIAMPLLFYLHQHVELLRHGYEIEALKKERVNLEERRRELALDRSRLSGLDQVERQATLLGLTTPDPLAIYSAPSGAAGGPAEGTEGPPDTGDEETATN